MRQRRSSAFAPEGENAPAKFLKIAGREFFVYADWTKFKNRFRSGHKKMDGFGSA